MPLHTQAHAENAAAKLQLICQTAKTLSFFLHFVSIFDLFPNALFPMLFLIVICKDIIVVGLTFLLVVFVEEQRKDGRINCTDTFITHICELVDYCSCLLIREEFWTRTHNDFKGTFW